MHIPPSQIQHPSTANKASSAASARNNSAAGSSDPSANQAQNLILASAKKVAVSQAFTTPFFHISVNDHPIFMLGQVIWRFFASLVPNRQSSKTTEPSNAAAKPTNRGISEPKLTGNNQSATAPNSSNGSARPASPVKQGPNLAPAPRKDVNILFSELRLDPTFSSFASKELQNLFKDLYVHNEIDETTLKAFIDANKSGQRFSDLSELLSDTRTSEKLNLGTKFFLVDCSSDVINKLTDESAKALIGSDRLTTSQIKLISARNTSFILDPEMRQLDPLDPARLKGMAEHGDVTSMNRYLASIGLR